MKKVLIYGKFNILHPGHLRLIRFAKTQGSHLVIGLFNTGNTVNPDIPIDLDERAENLQLINGIDEILRYTDVLHLLDIVKPDYVVKGYEFSQTPNPESEYIQKLGAQLLLDLQLPSHLMSSSGPENLNIFHSKYYVGIQNL